MMENVLELERVSVKFGGLVALNEVDLTVRRGEILSIIGPNGAGKTTLFNIMTGIYTPTSGQIRYKNQLINKLKPYKRVGLGIARTFQNTRLLKNMTVLENVLVAHKEVNTEGVFADRKSTRLNSSHVKISYAVFCLKKKNNKRTKMNSWT